MPLDENGHEICDPDPVAIPLAFKRPETLAEQIQRMVRTHVSQDAQNKGAETFEEADDFDTGDDDDDEPATPFEMEFDPVLGREVSPEMVRTHPNNYRDDYLAAAENDDEIQRQAETYHKKHVNRARGPSPKDGPPDPVADPQKKEE